MNDLVKSQILIPMEKVRAYCKLGHYLRNKHNIPVSYPLYEMHINSTYDNQALLKEEYQLIADELNIDHVEPIITTFSQFATLVTAEKDGLKVVLDITKDHYLDRRYEERKEHRSKMELRKLKDKIKDV